ncbi:MAG: hypothetical protein ACFFB8_18175 [Promethearchaeota archaeon]
MRDERKIIIRNERLRKIRNNLREIIIRAVYDEMEILQNFDNLYQDWSSLTPEEQSESGILQAKITNLFSLLSKSICACPLCTQTDKDMVYIDLYETWYCTECQEKDLIWYHPMGSEEDKKQHDYINYYYEQKEKFMKRFHNKY